MKIVQQNLQNIHSYKASKEAQEAAAKRAANIIKNILNPENEKERDADIIFLEEVGFNNCSLVINKLNPDRKNPRYNIVFPSDFDENQMRKSGFPQACMLAIKRNSGITFKKKRRSDIISYLRYVEGELNYPGERIHCFFAYVPNAVRQDRLENKKNMLNAIVEFCTYYGEKNEKFFVGGDLNTDVNDPYGKCLDLFRDLKKVVVSTFDGKTWTSQHNNEKQLDYAFISQALQNAYECETKELEATKGKSDHLGLITTITLRAKQK